MKEIKISDMDNWVRLMCQKALRNAKQQGLEVLTQGFNVYPNSAFIEVKFQIEEKVFEGKLLAGGEQRLENTVTALKDAIKTYTSDLNVVDVFIKEELVGNDICIILSMSNNIQIVD